MPFSHCTEISPPLIDLYRRDIDAPTAFTPHFRLDTPALATVNNPPAFGTTSEAPSNTPAFRRKRPLYVGAGYTGRRKRVVKPAPAEIAAGPDAAVSGKRRRLVTADDDVSPSIRSMGGLGHTSEMFGSVSPSRPLSLDAAANARSSTTDCACLGPFTSSRDSHPNACLGAQPLKSSRPRSAPQRAQRISSWTSCAAKCRRNPRWRTFLGASRTSRAF